MQITDAGSPTLPPTGNPTWGFYGAIALDADADTAWPLAMTAIAAATGCTPDEVHDFLDSRHGRHFADDVANGLFAGMAMPKAIAATAQIWMGWTIGRRTARETGIPQGLPYLTGFVMHAAIEAEAVA